MTKSKFILLTQPDSGGDAKEDKWHGFARVCIVLNGFVLLLGFSRSAGIIGGSSFIRLEIYMDWIFAVFCLSSGLGGVTHDGRRFRTIIGVCCIGVFICSTSVIRETWFKISCSSFDFCVAVRGVENAAAAAVTFFVVTGVEYIMDGSSNFFFFKNFLCVNKKPKTFERGSCEKK